MSITKAKACEGKQQLTEAAARRQVERLVAAGAAAGAVAAYRCPFGNHWHSGHVPGRGKRSTQRASRPRAKRRRRQR